MNQNSNVIFTQTARNSIAICQSFKIKQSHGDAVAAAAFIRKLTIDIHSDLAFRPSSFPQCTEAAEYGVDDIYVRNSSDGYRTFFSFDAVTNTVKILLVLHHMQDLHTALYTHCFLR